MDLRRGGASPTPTERIGEFSLFFPARMQSLPILLQKPLGLDELAIRVREILT